jgi:phospholipase C
MSTHKLRIVAACTALVVSVLLFAAAPRGGAAPAGAPSASFRHVIVIVQENRTPDNLF